MGNFTDFLNVFEGVIVYTIAFFLVLAFSAAFALIFSSFKKWIREYI